MQSYLVQVDHYTFGWVLFALMLIPFFLVARFIEGRDAVDDGARVEATFELPRQAATGIVLVATLFVTLLPAVVWGRLAQHEPEPFDFALPAIPGWAGPGVAGAAWAPRFHGPDAEALGSYRRSGQAFEVYVNWYRTQSQGRELVAYGNSVAGSKTAIQYDRLYVDPVTGIGPKLPEIREIMATYASGEERLIWYYFVVNEAAEARPLWVKIRQAFASLVGRSEAGVIAVATLCERGDDGCDRAREALGTHFAELSRIIRDEMIVRSSPQSLEKAR